MKTRRRINVAKKDVGLLWVRPKCTTEHKDKFFSSLVLTLRYGILSELVLIMFSLLPMQEQVGHFLLKLAEGSRRKSEFVQVPEFSFTRAFYTDDA